MPNQVFERLVFKHLFNHPRDNILTPLQSVSNILTPLQSVFIPGDSTVNQPTFLYNTFCRALDDGKEIELSFVISKRPLIVSGMQDFYINLKHTLFQILFLTGLRIFYL